MKKFIKSVRRRPAAYIVSSLILVIIGGLAIINIQSSINPIAYKPILDLVAKGESNGNYNAYFSNAGNTQVRFTDMTVSEVLQWQQSFVEQGSASNAVGRYQIIRPTLVSLVNELKLAPTETFNGTLQDRLAITLIERRGALKYVDGGISKEEFAFHLSKEWAALPKVIGDNPENSFYAGDGLNESRIESKEILNTIEMFKARAQSS